MTTGRLPAEHGIVANGFYWREQQQVGNVDGAERLHRAAADLGHSLAPRGRVSLGRLVSAAQQGVRGRFRLHARADPQSRRLRVALVLHAARGTLRHAPRRAGPFSAANFWGPMAGIASTAWIADSAVFAAGSGSPTSSTSTCRTWITPPSGRARQRRRPTRPWPIWTSSIGRLAAGLPTAYGGRTACGWRPANTRSCRSIT